MWGGRRIGGRRREEFSGDLRRSNIERMEERDRRGVRIDNVGIDNGKMDC